MSLAIAKCSTNALFSLAMAVTGVYEASALQASEETEVLKDDDILKSSWRDLSLSAPGNRDVFIDFKLVAEETDADTLKNPNAVKSKTVSLNKFKMVNIVASEADKSARKEVKENSPSLKGEKVNKEAATLAEGMKKPKIRMLVVMTEKKAEGEVKIDEKAIEFPKKSEKPKDEQVVLLEKVETAGSSLKALTQVQIFRK